MAAEKLGRKGYGFEIKKEFVKGFNEKLAVNVQHSMFGMAEKKKEYLQTSF